MTHDTFLIILHVPPSLEETIVDCLLSFENEQGFSSQVINAHDHKNEGLSIAEQVSGKQKKIRFQIFLAKSDIQSLISQLTTDFQGAGIHYWVQAIFDKGII